MDKVMARNRAPEEMYKSLSEEERKALENASDQDNKRQREGLDRADKNVPRAHMLIPPERLFRLLMEALRNRPK